MSLALFFLAVGGLTSLACGIWLIVIAVRLRKYIWIPLMLLVPFATIVFVILNWAEAKKPFLISLAAIPLMLIGMAVGMRSAAGMMSEETLRSMQSGGRLSLPTQTAPHSQEPAPDTSAEPEVVAQRRPGPPPVASPPVSARQPGPGAGRLVEPAAAPAVRAPRSVEKPAPTATATVTPAPPLPKPEEKPEVEPVLAAGAVAQPATVASIALAEDRPIQAQAGPPVTIEFAGLEDDRGEVLRNVRLRVTNRANQPVRKVKMIMTYVDRWGASLRSWTTDHEDPEGKNLAGAGATREITCPAFFMPDTTANVHTRVREITFVDGTIWRSP